MRKRLGRMRPRTASTSASSMAAPRLDRRSAVPPKAGSSRRAATDTGSRSSSTAASISASPDAPADASGTPGAGRRRCAPTARPALRTRAAPRRRRSPPGRRGRSRRRAHNASTCGRIERARRHRPRPPCRARPVADELQRRLDLADGARRRRRVEVGLVDDDQVGQLHDALLDRLQVVAGVGQLQQHEHVGHAGDRGSRSGRRRPSRR